MKGYGHKTIRLTCPQCKKEFNKNLSYYNHHVKNKGRTKFYCSVQCSGKSKKTIPDLFCKLCGKKIDNESGQKNRKFCSRDCWNKWQNNKEERYCKWCTKPFMAWDNGKQQYCSKKCALASTKETDIERLMREELEKDNTQFEQYKHVGGFFVDFLLPNNVIIECNGMYWHTKPEVVERDKRKNKTLEQLGYKIYRFTDKEIKSNVSKCVEKAKRKK